MNTGIAYLQDVTANKIRVTQKCIENSNRYYLEAGIDLYLIKDMDAYHAAVAKYHHFRLEQLLSVR